MANSEIFNSNQDSPLHGRNLRDTLNKKRYKSVWKEENVVMTIFLLKDVAFPQV
jgi:hypothetical protein